MSDSVRPHRQQPTRLLHPWDSPGKNTGVGCHFLLQCMKVKSESEVAEDEMVGWHHRLDGHEFEQALGDGEGQGSLACCSPWGFKESDTTERLSNKMFDIKEKLSLHVKIKISIAYVMYTTGQLSNNLHVRYYKKINNP